MSPLFKAMKLFEITKATWETSKEWTQALKNLNEISDKFNINTQFIPDSAGPDLFITTKGGIYNDEALGDFDIKMWTYFKCFTMIQDQSSGVDFQLLELNIENVTMSVDDIKEVGYKLREILQLQNVSGGHRRITAKMTAVFNLGAPFDYHDEGNKRKLIAALKYLQKVVH